MSVSPMATMKNLTQLQSRLAGLQGNVTAAARDGDTTATWGMQENFEQSASQLDDAAMQMRELHLGDASLLGCLREDTIRLAYNGGRLGFMREEGNALGYGWGSKLDNPVLHVGQAFDQCARPAQAAPEPPQPLQVFKELADTQSNLSHLSGRFTVWQTTDTSAPYGLDGEMEKLAYQLYDARTNMAVLHPEKAELIASLGKDALYVAGQAGRVGAMVEDRNTFGYGWGNKLDASIQDLRSAIAVLAE